MSSVDKLREEIVGLNSVTGWFDLNGDQLMMYKLLRVAELEAAIRMHEFLNSLIDPPIDDEERKTLYEKKRDDFLASNVGDGMDEERVDGEVEAMSDWEFVKNFGRLSDPEEEEEEGGENE